jgi:hypothetical protein
MFYMTFLASAPTTDFRVGVSMGTWETVITQPPDRGGRQTFSQDNEQWTVVFGKAPKMRFSHTVPRGRLAMQLVAVADDGSEHAKSVPSGPAEFRWPVSTIKEFRLQVRPYHWVEFQDVSLQPGWRTAVQVASLKKFD